MSATATLAARSGDAAFEGRAPATLSTDLMERLVVACKTRRVHDFLRDFDKHGLKRVEPAQAVRALSACGVLLSKADVKELTAAYTGAVSGGGGGGGGGRGGGGGARAHACARRRRARDCISASTRSRSRSLGRGPLYAMPAR